MSNPETALWIDGTWQPGKGALHPVFNPATGAEMSSVALAEAADFERAISGARAAFDRWSVQPAAARGEILRRIGALMTARREAMGRLLTQEQGKPLAQALGEVDYAASFFQWFGEGARRLSGRIQPHPVAGWEYHVRMVPAGVAGLITPWNFPLAQGAKKIAAALAAGCTTVWKPSEETPLVALLLGPLSKEAGLPDGVLQIVPALGPTAGEAFTADPRIRVLSLTGSTRTGRVLMQAASRHLPRLSFELGGNAPFVVMPDADLDRTAADLLKLKLLVSGQVCVTANRVFVPETRLEALSEKLKALLGGIKVGNGLSAGIDAGPLIHRGACQRVSSMLQEAVQEGASVLVENRTHALDPDLRGGSFFPPTVVSGVRDGMRLAREEIFGPVIPLLSYSDPAEAVRRANDTPYGLAAYVYGKDLAAAPAVADALKVGIVGVNEWRPLRAEIPFGGIGESGLGHEGGEEGILEFCGPKVVAVERPGIAGSP